MLELEEKIIALVNEAILPMEAKYFVVENIALKIKEAYLNDKLIKKEASNEQVSQ